MVMWLWVLTCGQVVAEVDCGEGAWVPQWGESSGVRHSRYRVVERHPHDPGAFTEGLVFHRTYLYESTGLYGHSSLRKIDLATGRIVAIRGLPPGLFGEGLTMLDGRLVQLTWRAGLAFVSHPGSLRLLGRLHYAGEGWGVTTVDHHLVMSNGSDTLMRLNPADLSLERTVTVRDRGRPVVGLNELEYVRGRILANVWPHDCVVSIDPDTGVVTAKLDLAGLHPRSSRQDPADVANGIAYDPQRQRLFVTGKRWPYLYVLSIE